MRFLCWLIGLINGIGIMLLLGSCAYNKLYNMEKRAEKIKDEIAEENFWNEMYYIKTFSVYYETYKPPVFAVINGKPYQGYMGKVDRRGRNVMYSIVVEDIFRSEEQ